MEDPVLASDGHIYEKDAIMKWYNTDAKHLSPMNRKTLNGEFKEQKELKIEIEIFLYIILFKIYLYRLFVIKRFVSSSHLIYCIAYEYTSRCCFFRAIKL